VISAAPKYVLDVKRAYQFGKLLIYLVREGASNTALQALYLLTVNIFDAIFVRIFVRFLSRLPAYHSILNH